MLTDHVWHMPIGYALGFIVLVLAVFTVISFFMNNIKKGIIYESSDLYDLPIIDSYYAASLGATTQYPNPNRQTMWNNLTDCMHTLGQTPQQAKLTK